MPRYMMGPLLFLAIYCSQFFPGYLPSRCMNGNLRERARKKILGPAGDPAWWAGLLSHGHSVLHITLMNPYSSDSSPCLPPHYFSCGSSRDHPNPGPPPSISSSQEEHHTPRVLGTSSRGENTSSKHPHKSTDLWIRRRSGIESQGGPPGRIADTQ